jgi:hypothetical protein
MTPYLRGSPAVLVLFLSVPAVFWAQTKTQRPDDKSPRAADGAGGTMVKKPPLTPNDDIAKLTVHKQSAPAAMRVAKSKEDPVVQVDKATVEIAALRQEIKDKQRKLELLMKMFVADEQPFIRNPSGQSGDDDLQMKRRYEQEELRQATVEIGQLKARLEMLVKVVEEKAESTTR